MSGSPVPDVLGAFGWALEAFLMEVTCDRAARRHVTVLEHQAVDHRLSVRRFDPDPAWPGLDGEPRVGFVATSGHLVVEVSIPLSVRLAARREVRDR